jgi:arginase
VNKTVAVVGVPMDLGAGRRGVDMGPSAIRYAGLQEELVALGLTVHDHGDLVVHHASRLPRGENPRLHYLGEVVRVNRELAELVAALGAAGEIPVVLGGDHSIGIGALAGAASLGKRLGVIWLDAHGDFNTDRITPSGNIHGMPLAVAVGRGHPDLLAAWTQAPFAAEKDVWLIGTRDLDPLERQALSASEVRVATMTEIDRDRMRSVVEQALDALQAVDHLHVSIDLDVIDPKEAPGVGTPVPGGITYREAHLVLEMIAESGRLGSLSVVEVNPILDDHNRTGQMAAGLIASALGKVIL